MNLTAKVSIYWAALLAFTFLGAGCSHTRQQQSIVVTVQLDVNGKVIDAKAVSGDRLLFNRAIELAKVQKYPPNCDSKGNPIASTTQISVLFDENNRFIKVEFPIIVGSDPTGLQLIKRVDPEYPDQLRRAGIKGRVTLEINVDKLGNVTEARFIEGDPQLADHAIKAVLQWKYRPYYLRCEPVPILTTVSMEIPRWWQILKRKKGGTIKQ
jgi:TonB family protein